MILIIAFTAVCGVMAVGSLKGWFQKSEKVSAEADDSAENEGSSLKIVEKSGIVFVERNGISYEVKEEDAIRDKDILRTKNSSEVTLADADGEKIFLGENCEFSVKSTEEKSFELTEGEVLITPFGEEETVTVSFDTAEASAKNAVLSISAYAASKTVYVYSGEATVQNGKLESSTNAESGNVISVLEDENGTVTAEVNKLVPQSLNDTQLQKLLSYSKSYVICFTAAEIEEVITVREEEKQAAQQAQMLLIEQAKADLEKEQEDYDKKSQSTTASTQSGADSSTTSIDSASTGSGSSDEDTSSESTDTYSYCTIEIRCDTILDNMENLAAGKSGYVPSNGVILSTSRIEFSEGETVFEVLKRACSRAGIQLEYSWTPLYNSYYIEGINNLYEFDCGNESGWMYKVNGWFPNYGCSSYDLEDGDTIVWCYTCNGLGADVGGGSY